MRTTQIIQSVKRFFYEAKSLCELSTRLHLTIVLFLLVQNIIVTFFRYYDYSVLAVRINLLEIAIYSLSVLLFLAKKNALSLMCSALCIPILFSIIVFGSFYPYTSASWFLLAFVSIYIMLIRGFRFRLLYLIFCLAIFFIPGIFLTYEYSENIIKIVQILTLSFIPLFISSFIEFQDHKISGLNGELEKRFQEQSTHYHILSQKNEDLLNFSYIMSHDLKAPLLTINSFTKLIREKISPPEAKIEQYFRYIEESSSSMQDLIEDMLMYHRLDSTANNFDQVDLNELLSSIKAFLQLERFEMKIEQLPILNGDRNLLKTLFKNLVSNGIKFQPKNEKGHTPVIWVKAEERSTHTCIYITDNGIGIPKRHLKNLFTPFKRFHPETEYAGSGLGLSICKKVMEKHRGQISVEKTSDAGTTFKLTFPKAG